MAEILTPGLARTFYNLADALAGEGGLDVDPLDAFEQSLRHDGLGEIRRVSTLLWLIERAPWLRGKATFSSLARAERRAELARWLERPGYGALEARIARVLPDHSSDGA